MNRDKQIEKMAKAIYNLDHCEGYKDDRGCMYAPTCSVCKYGRENKAKQISELLAKQGYRKASDVDREIFEEIEKETDFFRKYMFLNNSCKAILGVLAELKKKYIGEDTNVLTKDEEDEK